VLLAALLARQDLRSVERGNRLYRAGDVAGAAEIYARRAARGGGPEATYNLGTALLWIDPDSAKAVLQRTTDSEDRLARQRAFYNLGHAHFIGAETSSEPDSVLAALRGAVASFRSALRLDPTDQDARWNLALAIRRLSALDPPDGNEGEESGSQSRDEVPMNEAQLARSETAAAESGPEPENPRPADNIGERRGPREGAREAWAMQDPGPLAPSDALSLLSTVNDDPELLVKGTLWSQRPDVAWWSGQAYPGGLW
jgi:hypothetical protein